MGEKTTDECTRMILFWFLGKQGLRVSNGFKWSVLGPTSGLL